MNPPRSLELMLYEVHVGLASETRLIRIRAADPAIAIEEITRQFPGWYVLEIRRWGGEGWVAT